MTVENFMKKNNLEIVAGENKISNEIESVYIGDLLSWVMGNAEENSAWITIQGHINIVAVGVLINVSCIIVAEGAEVFEDTILKANEEGIPILKTNLTHYEISKKFMEEDI